MKRIPGTNKEYIEENAFDKFKDMIKLTDGLSLSQVCAISGIDSVVIQNWVKRGYVARPINKKYYERQLARILMINSLRGAMKIEDIGRLMGLINGDVDDSSDDSIAEEDLYNLFTRVIYHLDLKDDMEKTIKKVLKSENISNEKIYLALEVMVNAHISGIFSRNCSTYLKELETF